MIRPATFLLLEILGAMVAGVVILTGIAVWRLSSGPVEVDFLTPAIEAALSDPEAGLEVEVGRKVIAWGGWPKTFDTHAQAVQLRLKAPDGLTMVMLPEVSLAFSLRALVRGVLAPTVIEIAGAQATLIRTAEGRLRFGGG